jgi:hypothetical protein
LRKSIKALSKKATTKTSKEKQEIKFERANENG